MEPIYSVQYLSLVMEPLEGKDLRKSRGRQHIL